jgi:hypothetical protein
MIDSIQIFNILLFLLVFISAKRGMLRSQIVFYVSISFASISSHVFVRSVISCIYYSSVSLMNLLLFYVYIWFLVVLRQDLW